MKRPSAASAFCVIASILSLSDATQCFGELSVAKLTKSDGIVTHSSAVTLRVQIAFICHFRCLFQPSLLQE